MQTSKFFKLLFLFLIISVSVIGQTHRLSGLVMDKTDNTPIIGGIVLIKGIPDSTDQYSALTDVKGRFSVNVKKGKYKLTIQNMSYKRISQEITINDQDRNLGIMSMEAESKVLNEVIVHGQGPPAVQKGDTTEMSSSAYKTNPDANAEDLVKKMPGITVENGTIKSQGEEVKKVYVDGKQFFGDDPSAALKNLPADVIDKVQVFNKLSDQAELTGVDDGNSSRTMNIVTKQNRRSGYFGKLTAGTNIEDKYIASGNLNIFKGNRRVTLLGNFNNINQQNFSTLDLLGTSGGGGGGRGMGGGMGGGGGSFGGSQSGITKTKSFGLNYNDNWGKKITVSGSYFYNSTDNTLSQISNTEYLLVPNDNGKYSTTNSNTRTQNANHRMNLRIEYKIDSLNSLLIMPRISSQSNIADKLTDNHVTGGDVNTTSNNLSNTDATSYNLSNDLIWRHKFMKPQRTLSVNLSLNKTNRSSKNTQLANVNNVADNQFTDNGSDGFTYTASASYTEPVTKYGMLMLNLSRSNNHNETDKETFGLDENQVRQARYDSLSNVYNNDYTYNRGGLSYRILNGGLNLNVGVDYQQAILDGDQTFPTVAKVNKSYLNFLPNMMLMYKISAKSNLRVFYRTSTNAPSVTQLQDVIDNSNRLSLTTGNPKLKQEYSNTLTSNFSFANADKGINSFINLSGGYTKDNIGYRTLRFGAPELAQYDVQLQPGAQLNVPVNLDYSYNFRSLVNFGVYVKPIRSNVNMLGGYNFSQSPGYVNSLLNRSNSHSITNSLILASNISEKLDFSVSYTSNYNIAENSQESVVNTEYWYQVANFKFNWIFYKGFLLQTDLAGSYYKGLSANTQNQNSVVWNASFGKKFLKNNAAELKVSVFDILNQNNNFNRTVSASSIQDTRTNTFPRYFMVVFTYNLRKFNGQSEPQQQQRQWRGPSDGAPMMMPMGTSPGGSGPPPGAMQGPPSGF